ncbi:hypothetical protein JQC92_01840 [Shewanella sp. 202IG2-18]|nr:hypothetical protein [Parashewanella hymeniacidonis]MBM7070784.1 hypothetical protein [Parashewanella hymeniacidonis]
MFDKLVKTFCDVDDYCKLFITQWHKTLIENGMLKHIDIKNAVITADAMHCQKETTALICEGKGDYVYQVKKN